MVVATAAQSQPVQFGTDGIRGRAGETLTPGLALQLGYWYGQVLADDGAEGPVLLGMDSRCSSPMLTSALAAGLLAANRTVWDLGLCPTPAVAWLTKQQRAAGGLMVSASHNPPEDNGIKVFAADGHKLPVQQQRLIEAGLEQPLPGGVASGSSRSECHHLLSEYELGLAAQLSHPRFEGMKVVLDLCWGAATMCAATLFQQLGAEVVVLHGTADGRRINVGCGSTSLGPLRQAVLEHNANLGLAFDGDADRVLAVDHRGRPVDGDHLLFLWGCELDRLGQLPQRQLVVTQMSNLGFQRAWVARGGALQRTPVGDQHVLAAMRACGAALGGEQSGHLLWQQHHCIGDGLMTALQLVQLLCRTGQPLAQLVDDSFVRCPQALVNVRVSDRRRLAAWRDNSALQAAVLAAEAAMGEAGRVFVRASGTEPVLRVMVEATDAAVMQHWGERLVAVATAELVSQ